MNRLPLFEEIACLPHIDPNSGASRHQLLTRCWANEPMGYTSPVFDYTGKHRCREVTEDTDTLGLCEDHRREMIRMGEE